MGTFWLNETFYSQLYTLYPNLPNKKSILATVFLAVAQRSFIANFVDKKKEWRLALCYLKFHAHEQRASLLSRFLSISTL